MIHQSYEASFALIILKRLALKQAGQIMLKFISTGNITVCT